MAQVSFTIFGDVVTIYGTSVTIPWTGTTPTQGPTVATVTYSGTTVTVRFDKEITRVNPALSWSDGFAVTANGNPASPAIARKVAGGVEFEFTTAPALPVTVDYNGANLADAMTGATPAVSFAARPALAAFDAGRMLLIAYAPSKRGTSWYGRVGLWLTPSMSGLLRDYGPILADVSGSFGPINGFTSTVTAPLFELSNGSQASCAFNVNNDASDSIRMAKLWQQEVCARVAAALDAVRIEAADIVPSESLTEI